MKSSTFRELYIQDKITNKLNKEFDIFPFSVFFTYCKDPDGLLSITFFYNSDLKEFLEKINYKAQCDQSGYLIYDETNTVVLVGIALSNLIDTL